jgi:hypothetical protein
VDYADRDFGRPAEIWAVKGYRRQGPTPKSFSGFLTQMLLKFVDHRAHYEDAPKFRA